MGFVAPELVCMYQLRGFFAAVQADPSILDDAMERFSEDGREEIREFFTQRPLRVLSGWPQGNAQVPSVMVQLRPAVEQQNLQSITPLDAYLEETGQVTTLGMFTQTTVVCSCYGFSQREATFIGMAVWWALWASRALFNSKRMLQQVITFSDYEPVPSNDEAGGIWFLRNVNLTCLCVDTFVFREGPLIADFTLTAQDDRVAAS